jgi:hypothetical protein
MATCASKVAIRSSRNCRLPVLCVGRVSTAACGSSEEEEECSGVVCRSGEGGVEESPVRPATEVLFLCPASQFSTNACILRPRRTYFRPRCGERYWGRVSNLPRSRQGILHGAEGIVFDTEKFPASSFVGLRLQTAHSAAAKT